MQRQNKAYVGLDIGTSAVRCMIGIQEENKKDIQVIGLGISESEGVRRGSVINVEEIIEPITKAVDEAERTSGYTIESATIGINGNHLNSQHSKGVIAVTGGNDRTIDEADVERVEEAASVVQLPPNREILHVFARSYSLDGQSNIQNPLGMTGVRLEAETLLVTASTPSLKNSQKALAHVGLSLNDRYINGIAAGHIGLTKKQKETGAALVDIGHSTTGVMLFEEKEPLFFGVIPVGGSHITNDIAIGLQIDLHTAERLKLEYSKIADKIKKQSAVIKDSKGNEVKFRPSLLRDIIEARTEEIFEAVNKQLMSVNKAGDLPGGVVIAGGGAKLHNIIETSKSTTKLPSEIIQMKEYSGITDNLGGPEMTTVSGLMELDKIASLTPRNNFKINIGNVGILRTFFERFKP